MRCSWERRLVKVPLISLTTRIAASCETVFDLSCSIDLHLESTAQTREKAVAGRTSGLIGPGEEVTWEATHFGIRQRLTTRIVEYDRPRHFRDAMVDGAFARFDHDHHFEPTADEAGRETTIMTDTFDYTSPWGPLGRLADWLFLQRYMRRLLQKRNALIKTIAESGNAQRYLKR